MPSTFRTLAVAAVLTAVPSLYAAPANAQPQSAPAAQTEEGSVERLWQWLTDLWAPSGTLERMQDDSILDILSYPPASNRGGVYDPNGQS